MCCWQAEVRALTRLFGLLDVGPEQQVGSLDAGLHLPQAEGVGALLPLASLGHRCTARLRVNIHPFIHSVIHSLTHLFICLFKGSFKQCLSQGLVLYSPDQLPVWDPPVAAGMLTIACVGVMPMSC